MLNNACYNRIDTPRGDILLTQPPTRTVDRALEILLCFSQDEPSLTLTQISERVGMHKSTVYRLLATLENKRFIQRVEENNTYRLGLGLVKLGALVLKSNNIHRQATPYMNRLSVEFRETVDLAILDGNQVLYLQVIESPNRVKLATAPGERLPAFCTATGKAFLAFLPDDQVQKILKEGMRKYTEHTTTSIPEICQDLNKTRERGFSISEQEYEAGVNAVAAPILDGHQHPLAVMAIVGPAFRLPLERLMQAGKTLRATTDAIAQDLGLPLQYS